MHYTVNKDDRRGRHIVFAQPIDESNFIAACSIGIELAKALNDEVCAVNFTANGVDVQVVQSDNAATQFDLWRRRLPLPNAPSRSKQPTPHEFGRIVRQLRPGCSCTDEALADWHRRVALSILPNLGFTVGSARSVRFIQDAGL